MNQKIPKWLSISKLKEAAEDQVKENSKINVSLPIKSHNVITSYKCGGCKLQFTFNDVKSQIKEAARTGSLYVECPKCGGVIEAGKVINVPDSQSIIQRALRMNDSNAPPSRSINTWIDKAIYGKLVDNLGKYIEKFGISNPQLRFQRGIRTEKFPGEPHSAKGAEFTVEFVDTNNTRNRIVIQAGLTPKGEFICPRTFKTLSGNEYPLTKLAIEDFTSGKIYAPVSPKHNIRPLNYKQRDITDFRVISADNKKIVKKAVIDDQQLDKIVQGMNITDPADQQTVKGILSKYYDPNNPQQTFNADLNVATQQLVSPTTLADHSLNLKKISVDVNWLNKTAIPEVTNLINSGLAYSDAYDEAYRVFRDKYGVKLEQPEWDLLWNTSIDTLNNETSSNVVAEIAEKLIKHAEINTVKFLHKTAEDVVKEFDLTELTADESKEWIDTYTNTYNTTLNSGEGVVEASRKAETTADNTLASNRVKLALRDKQTLVPFVETDPDYSIAGQTEFSEKRFDVPYNETDAGISDEKDRNYTTMFKGSSVQKESYIRHENDKWVVHSESGDVLGKHDTKEKAEKQLQAIEISKHKKGSVKLAGYSLTPTGDRSLTLLSSGNPVGNYEQRSLLAILAWITGHPNEMLEGLETFAASEGLDLGVLRQTFNRAVSEGMVNVTSDMTTANVNKTVKEGEATGTDLDSEEVGQNPINYSRLKQIVEDLLRAGNIPPTKVDLHALKDGKYKLEELRDLVDIFKVKEDTFFPTTHASFDRNEIIKLAEDKVADLVKEMPLEKVEDVPHKGLEFESETPLQKALEGGAIESPLEEAVEELVKDEYKGQMNYHELAENPEIVPAESEMAVSHEMDEREHAHDLLELMDRLREEAQKNVNKESGNFQKRVNKVADGLVDPFGKPLRSQEPQPEVTPIPEEPKPEFVTEPGWRQRSVDISKLPGEARSATPEEKELFSFLELNKLELEKADTEIQLLRQVIKERHQKELADYEKGVVGPISQQRQDLHSKMTDATEKLAGLLRESQNKYIDIDNRYKAFLTQRSTSHTAPVNWQQVVNKIKEKAPELQALIDEIVKEIKTINQTEKQIEQLEFWPAKTKKSADESSLISYMATLYQDVYNNLSELLSTLTSLDQELIAATS